MESKASGAEELVAAGRDALARFAWAEARAHFEAALARAETAEACEGLGLSANWLQDERGVFDGFERAYRLYREGGDARGAARAALGLANASVEYRGAPAVANGWLQRTHRLIDQLEPVPEQGWLALWEGHQALMIRNDASAAREQCGRAVELGKAFHDPNLEMAALAVQGLALVSAGLVGEGLSCLDEAAAAVLSGDLTDVEAMSTVLCYLMDACDRVRDYERASQWCSQIKEFAETHNFGLLYSVCRPHYAVVLMWRGEWGEAEEQLSASERELLSSRAAMAVEAVVRLAELRWRQGRWGEAAALFKRVEQEELSQLGRAELALSEGDAALAGDLVERYLRRIPAENRIERAAGLELMVRARLAAGRDAQTEAQELLVIAREVGTPPLLGWGHMAASGIARVSGDFEAWRREAEDAVYQFDRAGAPFEGGRARLEVAQALGKLGRVPNAAGEAQMALDAFRRLGAKREAERAVALLREFGAGAATKGASAATKGAAEVNPARLTDREVDLVRLIASGKSNQEIAGELVLSLRTVERHLSNIYGKLGADGKTARAAAAAYAFRNGLI